MREHLEYIFSNVNDWLKFAEAKSATLLAANGVLLFGIVRLASNIQQNKISTYLTIISCGIISCSLLLCLSSFIPSLTIPRMHKKCNRTDEDNLLFFGHIENYNPSLYIDSLKASCAVNDAEETKYCYMIADQIIANSVIASYKYSIFTKAVWLTLIGLASGILAAAANLWV